MEPALPDLPNDDDAPSVLVIDDDPDVREGLTALFESVNLQSRAFGSVPEFVHSEWPERVRCLVLDVRLPGLSGIDFQTQLAALQIDIPIIFITGHGDIPMSVKAMKAGAVDFLSKPLREQELLDAVRVGLDRDRNRREHDDVHVRFAALSSRERQVMTLVAAGLMNKQVAAELGISEVTVKVHRHNITKKLAAKSFPDLVRMAEIVGLPHGTIEALDQSRVFGFVRSRGRRGASARSGCQNPKDEGRGRHAGPEVQHERSTAVPGASRGELKPNS
jgi:FixJ family two-component response regulator